MTYQRAYDWKAVIRAVDPEAEHSISAFISHTINNEAPMPRKMQELFLMACSAALRYGISTRVHGLKAIELGATRGEVVNVLSIVSIQAGFTAFVDAVEALGDALVDPSADSGLPGRNTDGREIKK